MVVATGVDDAAMAAGVVVGGPLRRCCIKQARKKEPSIERGTQITSCTDYKLALSITEAIQGPEININFT